MAYTKKITKGVFDAVKILLQGGASVKEISKYLGISDSTIYVIRDSEKYEEYEQFVAEKCAKRNAARAIKRREEKAAQPVEQPDIKQEEHVKESKSPSAFASVYQVNRLIEEMTKQNEHLKNISNKLAYIVEQLA